MDSAKQELIFVSSLQRSSGDPSNCTFDINPPVAGTRGKWKILTFQMLGAVGPPNDTTVEVRMSYKGHSPTQALEGIPVVTAAAKTYYPALNDLILPGSLYDDKCGYEPVQGYVLPLNGELTENSPVLNGGPFNEPIAEALTPQMKDEFGITDPKPTPAAWLYSQYTPAGWSESNGGAIAPSGVDQIAAQIQHCIRTYIAETLLPECTSSKNPTAARTVYEPRTATLRTRYVYKWTRYEDDPPSNYPEECEAWATSDVGEDAQNVAAHWNIDWPQLFRMVPPGATVSHVCSAGLGGVRDRDQPLWSGQYLLPVTYEFTNVTNKWAFVFFYDTAMNFLMGKKAGGSARAYTPWLVSLEFRIKNPAVCRLFGIEPGVWQNVGVPGPATRATFDNNFQNRPYLWMDKTARWPTEYCWPDQFLNQRGWDMGGTDLDRKKWNFLYGQSPNVPYVMKLVPTVAEYAPKSVLPPPPMLAVHVDLIGGLQTRFANNEPSTVAMLVPLPTVATDVIQYTNTTTDWSLQRRTDRISQFRIYLTDGEGVPLNNEATLPSGYQNRISDNNTGAIDRSSGYAGVFSTPDWYMEIVFE